MEHLAIRTLLYVSTSNAASPQAGGGFSDLPYILVRARRWNSRHGITGGIGCHGACYVQILEGVDAAVVSLFEKIQNDPRHRNLRVLVDAITDQRVFPEESLLILNQETGGVFGEYVSRHLGDRRLLDTETVSALRYFGWSSACAETSNDVAVSAVAETAMGDMYALREWPDFDLIEPTQDVLDACAMLRSRYIGLSSLVNGVFNGDEAATRHFLAQMDSQGILRHQAARMLPRPVVSEPAKGGFYQRMRAFLRGEFRL